MGSFVRGIVVPVVGLLAVGCALALVAFAPDVLFPGARGPLGPFSVPPASREVARVSAPPKAAEHTGRPGSPTPTSTSPLSEATSSGAPITATLTGGEVEGVRPGKSGKSALRRGREGAAENPGEVENGAKAHGRAAKPAKTHGQAGKDTIHGKAKGHYKPKAQGKAKGHYKKKPDRPS